MKTAFLLLFLCTLTSAGWAHESTVQEQVPPTKDHQLSLTISPILLAHAFPVATLDVRILDQLSAAFSLGTGTGHQGEQEYLALMMAGQIRYYALGDFDHGMQVGGLYRYFWLEPSVDGVLNSAVGGHTPTAFIGYKLIMEIGLTFDAQIGAGYFLTSDHPKGGDMSDQDRPVFHWMADIGWSF